MVEPITEYAQRVPTAVAARRDTRQAVHEFQFTKCWIVDPRPRRFGMDAELCGCAVLGGELLFIVLVGWVELEFVCIANQSTAIVYELGETMNDRWKHRQNARGDIPRNHTRFVEDYVGAAACGSTLKKTFGDWRFRVDKDATFRLQIGSDV